MTIQLNGVNSSRIFMGQLIAGFLSLISVSLTAIYVGPKIFGFCSILILICNVFMNVADYGGCSWAARELASKNIGADSYIFVMKSKGRLNLIFLLALPFLFLLLPLELKWSCLLSFYPYLWVRYNYLQQFLICTGRNRESILLVIGDRASWLLILPLVHFNVSRDLAFVIPILAGLVLHAYLGMRLLPISKKLKLRDSNLTALNIFSKSRHFGMIGFSAGISNLDGFAVGVTSTLESSGSYVLAQRFRNPLTIVFNAIAIRIKPVAASRDRKKIISELKADFYLILTGIVSVLLGSLSAFFYSDDIFGPEYVGIEKILAIGTLASLPYGFVLIATGLLTSIGNEMYVSRANWFYAASLMFNVIFGVQYLGTLGGVIGSCLTISVYSLIVCVKLKKELGNLL